eukprot:Gb_23090 [translate_table: standard]
MEWRGKASMGRGGKGTEEIQKAIQKEKSKPPGKHIMQDNFGKRERQSRGAKSEMVVRNPLWSESEEEFIPLDQDNNVLSVDQQSLGSNLVGSVILEGVDPLHAVGQSWCAPPMVSVASISAPTMIGPLHAPVQGIPTALC